MERRKGCYPTNSPHRKRRAGERGKKLASVSAVEERGGGVCNLSRRWRRKQPKKIAEIAKKKRGGPFAILPPSKGKKNIRKKERERRGENASLLLNRKGK